MPESKKRKKARPAQSRPKVEVIETSPQWWAPVMVTLMIVGLVWVVITYLMGGRWPLPIGNYNLLIGIVFMMSGFLMTLKWR